MRSCLKVTLHVRVKVVPAMEESVGVIVTLGSSVTRDYVSLETI